MKDNVCKALSRWGMILPGDRVTVAFSGGADSTALLHFLREWREEVPFELAVCHVNHLLRGDESQRDEAFVRTVCRRWQLPLTVFREDVAAGAKEAGESVELYGRKIRYRRLREAAANGKIATAHTLNDQAETTLLNLLRGTGLKGLCAIPPVQGQVIRPLILCTREEVERYCARNGLLFVTDSSNFSPEHTRNRVRMQVIPQLEELQPAFWQVYGRMLSHLREDSDYLEEKSARALEQVKRPGGLAGDELLALHGAIRFRVLRRFLEDAGLDWDAALLARMEKLCGEEKGRLQLTRGVWLTAANGLLALEREPEEVCFAPVAVQPGPLPENPLCRGQLILLNCEQFTNLQKQKGNILKKTIDYDKIYGKLFLRQKSAGDYLRPAGRPGKPLRKWYSEAKVPPRQRDRIPVFADEVSPVWVKGFGADRRVAPDEKTQRFLVFDIEEELL